MPTIDDALIDDDERVIWRKIGRTDPRKIVRKLRAVASSANPALRLTPLDWIFQPTRIDFECRPYELGWLLYAWLKP
jgi:hypothetical protein